MFLCYWSSIFMVNVRRGSEAKPRCISFHGFNSYIYIVSENCLVSFLTCFSIMNLLSFFFNVNFIEIQIVYYTNQPFKVYNRKNIFKKVYNKVNFSIFIRLCNHQHSQFEDILIISERNPKPIGVILHLS